MIYFVRVLQLWHFVGSSILLGGLVFYKNTSLVVVGQVFLKHLSFKIAMSERASVGHRPRLTFWLTIFQSYMLPLFFSGLLSYLIGMKRRASRCFPLKRDNSHFLHYLKNPSIMSLGIFLVSFCPPPFRRKVEGHCFWFSVGRGAWFRVFSRYFVPLTPPTVFVRSF